MYVTLQLNGSLTYACLTENTSSVWYSCVFTLCGFCPYHLQFAAIKLNENKPAWRESFPINNHGSGKAWVSVASSSRPSPMSRSWKFSFLVAGSLAATARQEVVPAQAQCNFHLRPFRNLGITIHLKVVTSSREPPGFEGTWGYMRVHHLFATAYGRFGPDCLWISQGSEAIEIFQPLAVLVVEFSEMKRAKAKRSLADILLESNNCSSVFAYHCNVHQLEKLGSLWTEPSCTSIWSSQPEPSQSLSGSLVQQALIRLWTSIYGRSMYETWSTLVTIYVCKKMVTNPLIARCMQSL